MNPLGQYLRCLGPGILSFGRFPPSSRKNHQQQYRRDRANQMSVAGDGLVATTTARRGLGAQWQGDNNQHGFENTARALGGQDPPHQARRNDLAQNSGQGKTEATEEKTSFGLLPKALRRRAVAYSRG